MLNIFNCFAMILQMNFFLLRRLVGVRNQTEVSKLAKDEYLMVSIGSKTTGGKVLAVKRNLVKLQLTYPVCTSIGEKIALSRRVKEKGSEKRDLHWRLIGWGELLGGTTLDIPPSPISFDSVPASH